MEVITAFGIGGTELVMPSSHASEDAALLRQARRTPIIQMAPSLRLWQGARETMLGKFLRLLDRRGGRIES